jgi:hypothetical protein
MSLAVNAIYKVLCTSSGVGRRFPAADTVYLLGSFPGAQCLNGIQIDGTRSLASMEKQPSSQRRGGAVYAECMN